jgi:hypothetical protein
VKCDETKPDCMRCTSTGRRCEGYPISVWPAPAPSLYTLTWDNHASNAERRSFSYMRERAIYDISGYFESDFWDRLVLRISSTEPVVRHALLGLSSLCETYYSRGLNELQSESHAQFALQQYNKAVRLLSDSLSTSKPQLDVVLTSCLVFVWLEFMRNDLDAGLRHLKSGLKILDDFHRPSGSSRSPSELIDASLIRAFWRLKIQATVYGGPMLELLSDGHGNRQNSVPVSFSSIEEARNTLQSLLAAAFRFVRQIGDPSSLQNTPGFDPRPDFSLLDAKRLSLLGLFGCWQTSIENSPALRSDSPNSRRTAAMCLLRVYHQTVVILLETLFTQSQMIYDSYDRCFNDILTLAEQLIRNSQHMGRAIFFDMGVMAPLFYVILKCRNLELRRRALSLLELAPCREGMWYRQDAVEYAKWKIGIEERNRGQSSEMDALPEVARISNERMQEVIIDGRKRVLVSFQRQSVDGIERGEEITDLSMRIGRLI